MKHKAKLDLELSDGDVFEQEVMDAMRAFAKTISRRTFEGEIKEQVIDTAKSWTQKLYERKYSEPMTDRMVREVVYEYIKNQLTKNNIVTTIRQYVDEKMSELKGNIEEYIHAEVKKCIESSMISDMVQKEIEQSVQQTVLDLILGKMKHD